MLCAMMAGRGTQRMCWARLVGDFAGQLIQDWCNENRGMMLDRDRRATRLHVRTFFGGLQARSCAAYLFDKVQAHRRSERSAFRPAGTLRAATWQRGLLRPVATNPQRGVRWADEMMDCPIADLLLRQFAVPPRMRS
jgi:hypothetical protein